MYDPFIDRQIPSDQPTSDSYWQSTASIYKASRLDQEIETDVVIIGGGFTGLCCAISTTQGSNSSVVVLEANNIGWGCSSRNAGFVLPGSGRLSYQQMESRYGLEQAQVLHQQYMDAISLVEKRVSAISDHADKTEKGYLKLAHSSKWFDKLQHSADYLAKHFDYEVETFDSTSFKEQFVDHNKVFGAIRYKNGFGVNPLKLVNHYASLALNNNVQLFEHSPVIDIHTDKQAGSYLHTIKTSKGSVRAKKVVIATNGYTPKGLPTPLSGKILPVLTSVIVTRPLTSEELKRANFLSHQVMMDTRELKYYYRLLPDNRILFGGRSAISGKASNDPKYQQRLLAELKETFVGLEKVSLDYVWSGWISVAFDQMPHLFRTSDDIFYATGYCGSGVSFSSWAGDALGKMINEESFQSPLLTELPRFPFSPFRRLGQRMFYQYGRLKDALG